MMRVRPSRWRRVRVWWWRLDVVWQGAAVAGALIAAVTVLVLVLAAAGVITTGQDCHPVWIGGQMYPVCEGG